MTIERVVVILAALGASLWLLLCLGCLTVGIVLFVRYRKLKRVLTQRYGFWLELWQTAEKKEWAKWAVLVPLLPILWWKYTHHSPRRPFEQR